MAVVAAAAGILAASACDSTPAGRLPVHPVKGKVLFKGSPLAEALVVFERTGGPDLGGGGGAASEPGPIRATGRTDADGVFELMTYEFNDGAPAGEYAVGISSMPPRTEEPIFGSLPTTKPNRQPDVLKGRYEDPKKSGLTATVTEGPNELPPFDLK